MYDTPLLQTHAAGPTKRARTGPFVHMLGNFSLSSCAQKSQRSVLGYVLESLGKRHEY